MKYAFIAALFLTLAGPSHAQEMSEMEKLNELVVIRENTEMLQTLGERGVLLQSEARIAEQLAKAGKLVGIEGPITHERLVELTGGSSPPPNPWQKFIGFFTFVNIIMVIAAIMLTVAVGWLFGLYFLSLILAVPLKAWEAVAYASCLALIGLGSMARENVQLLWVLPACFGLVGALKLNYHNWWEIKNTHRRAHETRSSQSLNRFNHFASLVLAIAWGMVAYAFDSQVVGFMAVGALMTFLGFACGMVPGVVWIGFEDDSENVVPRATIAAFCLGALYTGLRVTGRESAFLDTFGVGISWWGYFVFYLGMLTMSSKYWSYESSSSDRSYTINWNKYFAMQFLTICAGVAALYIGSIYQIDLLMGIGGTFFVLYLLEKWYDLPWDGVGWAWSLLGLSVFLYIFVIVAQRHPEYFLLVAT